MKTFLRWCAALVGAVVLLVVVLYVGQGLHGMTEVAAAKRQAAADLATALPASEQRADADREQVREAVAADWGAPAYSWQELVCGLGTVDAGWIVQSYTQECRIRSVDLVPVARAAGPACEPVPVDAGHAAAGADPEAPRSGVDVRRGPTSAFVEEQPYVDGCPGGIVRPPRSGASRLLSGTRPESLAESPAWVVVSVDTEVSSTDLGCSPWGLIFCSEPVDRPVLGDLG